MGCLLSIPSIASSVVSVCRKSCQWLLDRYKDCGWWSTSQRKSSSKSSSNPGNQHKINNETTNMAARSISSTNESEHDSTLGDVWQGDRLVDAYQAGHIRSIPVPVNDDAGEATDAARSVQVEFINQSPTEELILCWISASGELHHFHELPPTGGGRLEISKVGDAFVLFHKKKQAGDVTLEGKDPNGDVETGTPSPHIQASCIIENLVAAYRSTSNSNNEGCHIVTIRPTNSDSGTAPSQAPSQASSSWLRGSKKQKVGPSSPTRHYYLSSNWTVSVRPKPPPPEPAPPTPIDTRHKVYQSSQYGPWTVHCEPNCWDGNPIQYPDDDEEEEKQDQAVNSSQAPTLHEAFQADMDAISRRFPRHVRDVLCQSTHIFMNATHPYGQAVDNPVGCYHPGREWLEEHLMNPDKCGQVEFYNVQQYYKHRRLWGTGAFCVCVCVAILQRGLFVPPFPSIGCRLYSHIILGVSCPFCAILNALPNIHHVHKY